MLQWLGAGELIGNKRPRGRAQRVARASRYGYRYPHLGARLTSSESHDVCSRPG